MLQDVYTPAVQCPECQSSDYRVYRTCPAERDGSVTRYAQCQACGERFKLITEPPDPSPSIPHAGNERDA